MQRSSTETRYTIRLVPRFTLFGIVVCTKRRMLTNEQVYRIPVKSADEPRVKRKYTKKAKTYKRQYPKTCDICGKICKGNVGLQVHRHNSHGYNAKAEREKREAEKKAIREAKRNPYRPITEVFNQTN